MKLLLLLLAPCLMAAQVPEDSARLASLIRGGRLYLSLQDAIALALENNLDLELQRFGPRFAGTDLERTGAGGLPRGVPLSVREGPKSAASGTSDGPLGPGPETNLSIAGQTPLAVGTPPLSLDSALTGRVLRNHSTAVQANSFAAGTPVIIGDASTWNLAWQKGFLTGGTLIAGFDNTRQSVNNLRFDVTPINTSSLGVSFTQPLLRGFGRALNSRFIRIARNNQRQSELVFRQQAISTVAAAVRLYWDLAAMTEEIAVRGEAVRRAEKLLNDNQEQVDAGTRAPIEAVRARAEVARARRDLIAAEGLSRQQQIILKDYLSRKTATDPLLESVPIVLTDPLRVDRDEKLPAAGAIAEAALKTRPDIDQARVQIESGRIALAGTKDSLRPSLDLVASARNNGLAGEVNPLTIPGAAPHNPAPGLVGGYGTALGQLFRRNYPDYGVGVQFNIPLRNRAAEADYARDGLALRLQEVRLLQLTKQVHVEVQNALVALDQARATLDAVEREREFQERALEAEGEKLAVGASTTFLVVQYQRDLAQARAAEVTARAGYVRARVALHRAAGTLLETVGVSVAGSDVRLR